MDNLFKSVSLLEELKTNGYFGTETVRVIRIGKSCPPGVTTIFNKSQRGARRRLQTKTLLPNNSSGCCIKLAQWLDNGVVTIASSLSGTRPLITSRRWLKTQHKNVNIATPKSVYQ